MVTAAANNQQGDSGNLDPGASLRAARVTAGLSTRDVAEQLNLLVTHVEALENNDFSRFNANLFARGHVRSYARLFDLDDAGLLQATNQRLREMEEVGRTPPPKVKRPPVKPHIKVITALIGTVILWSLAVLLESHHRQESRAQVEPLAGLVDPLPFEVVTPLGAELLRRANGQHEEPADDVPPEAHLARLTLDFEENCWVQIKNPQGDILVSGLQKKGEHLELSAEAPMEVLLAYWPAVTLYFNGEPIDLRKYTSGNAARLRIFES